MPRPPTSVRSLTALIAGLATAVAGASASAQTPADPHEIAPLVEEYCSGCHGPLPGLAG